MNKNLFLVAMMLLFVGIAVGQNNVKRFVKTNEFLEKWKKIESLNVQQNNDVIKVDYKRLDSMNYFYYQEREEFIGGKELFYYNDNNLIIKYENYYEEYELGTNILYLEQENIYEYNENNLLVAITETHYTESDYFTREKTTFTYTNGLLTEAVNTYYNSFNDEWINNTKTTFTYNDQGYLIEELVDQWAVNDSEFRLFQKFIYTVNENGDVTDIIEQTYYHNNNTWNNISKTSLEYFDVHIVQVETEFYWENDDWVSGSRTTTEFDDLGNILTIIDGTWIDDVWHNLYKTEFYYVDGLIQEIYYFNFDASIWMIDNEFAVVTLDAEVPTSQLIYPYDIYGDMGFFKRKLDKFDIYIYDELGDNILVNSEIYYWSDVEGEITINDIDETQSTVYPNPTSDFIRFKLGDYNTTYNFKVTNIEGKTVLEKEIDDNSSVSVSNLEDGIYLFSITDNNNTYNGKFVKK